MNLCDLLQSAFWACASPSSGWTLCCCTCATATPSLRARGTPPSARRCAARPATSWHPRMTRPRSARTLELMPGKPLLSLPSSSRRKAPRQCSRVFSSNVYDTARSIGRGARPTSTRVGTFWAKSRPSSTKMDYSLPFDVHIGRDNLAASASLGGALCNHEFHGRSCLCSSSERRRWSCPLN